MALIVDSQVHIWLPEGPDRRWPEWGRKWRSSVHHPQRVDAALLQSAMRDAGVDRALIVPPVFEGFRNDYALATAHAHPDRFRVMARLDLLNPDFPEEFAELADNPMVAGIRLSFLPLERTAAPTSTQAEEFWELAEDRGLPVMVVAPAQLPAIGVVAARHPRLRLTIDNLGLSGSAKDAAIADEIRPLLDLAAHPNVSVKLTALPCYSTDPYPHRGLHKPVKQVMSAFGIERLFWASDLSRVPDYRQCLTLVTDHLGLDEGEAHAVLGGNVMKWLPWPHN